MRTHRLSSLVAISLCLFSFSIGLAQHAGAPAEPGTSSRSAWRFGGSFGDTGHHKWFFQIGKAFYAGGRWLFP